LPGRNGDRGCKHVSVENSLLVAAAKGLAEEAYGLLIYSSHVTYPTYGIATQPMHKAMYIEARGEHWLLGSLSWLT